jgi:hypothetical protein
MKVTVKPSQTSAPPLARRWLLFVHQVPSQPSNVRVRTWRRLQQLGAIAVKQAVYVLPDSPESREDFQWLKSEIESAGGEASVFAAESLDTWSDDGLIQEFRAARQRAYAELAAEIEATVRPSRSRRKPSARNTPPRVLEAFRERMASIDRVDFFGSPGRDRVITLIEQVSARGNNPRRSSDSEESDQYSQTAPRGALWVTRPRPAVDRMASAWLIRRFIDPKARFAFAADAGAVPARAIPFDMFGVELSHHGEQCTFETLCERFGIVDATVARIGAIVHDLDLKDNRFAASDAPTVGLLVEGLQLSGVDDDELLDRGLVLFDALYRSFERAVRNTQGRPSRGSGRPTASKKR